MPNLENIPTPAFIGLDSNDFPISWGESAHVANNCAGFLLARTVPASRKAVQSFCVGCGIQIHNGKAYASEEVV